jgi:hypothetical protein
MDRKAGPSHFNQTNLFIQKSKNIVSVINIIQFSLCGITNLYAVGTQSKLIKHLKQKNEKLQRYIKKPHYMMSQQDSYIKQKHRTLHIRIYISFKKERERHTHLKI